MDDKEHDNNPITVDEMMATSKRPEPVRYSEGGSTVRSEGGDDEAIWTTDSDCKPREFDLNGTGTENDVELPQLIPDEADRLPETNAAKLLRIHYDFGHTSFAKLKEMAKQGIIPKKLARCSVPVCSACEYAKATK